MVIKRFLKDTNSFFKVLSFQRRLQFIFCILISIFSASLELINIALVAPFLKGITQNEITNTFLLNVIKLNPFFKGSSLIMQLSLILIFTILGSAIIRFLTVFIIFKLSALITSDLSSGIFQKSLEMPYMWHQKTNSSILQSYLTIDLDNTWRYLAGLLKFIVNLTIVIILSSYLIFLYPIRTCSILLIIASAYGIIFFFLKSNFVGEGRQISKQSQQILQISEETLNNIALIKVSNKYKFFEKKFNRAGNSFRNLQASINIKLESPKYFVESFILILIVSLSTISYIRQNSLESEITFLGTIFLGIYKMLIPIQNCYNGLGSMKAYLASFSKILEFLLLDETSNIKQIKFDNIKEKYKTSTLLQFKDLSFNYNSKDNYKLEIKNLIIEKGEKIGIIGTSGSGKSTFIKLLIGLIEPKKGKILFDGNNIFENTDILKKWQKNISYVSQDVYLSDNDINHNIAFGVEEEKIIKKRIINSAKLSQIHEFIQSLPDKYLTLTGEKGTKLSGGQKQRIAIARGLYENQNLLVLDEALSALDSKNEIQILEKIFDAFRSKTVIIVSHRLTSLKNCDRIIVFDKGKIDEIADYEYLKNNNKLFLDLLKATTN